MTPKTGSTIAAIIYIDYEFALATVFLLVSLLAGCGKKEDSADKKGTPEASAPNEVAGNGAPDRVTLTADERAAFAPAPLPSGP